MSYDDQNIFAKIISGEIPCDKLHESEFTIVFEDIRPQAPSHILIIPRGKYKDINDFSKKASDEEIIDFNRSIAVVADKLGVSEDISVTLPRTSFKDIKVDYKFKNNVQAPIKKGSVMGSLDIISNDEVVLTTDLLALNDVDAKGFFGRIWSKFVLWIMSLFGLA